MLVCYSKERRYGLILVKTEKAQPENSDVETGEETSKLSVHIDTPVTSKHSSLHEQK